MRRRALAVTLLGLAAGCGDDDADPSTLLTDEPRLLAIAADPPVLGPDGAAALAALVVGPGGAPLDRPVAWRACSPWQVVRDPDLDCPPARALVLAPGADDVVRLDAAAALAAFGGPAGGTLPAPEPGPCPPPVVAVPVIATVEVDGTRLLARKDVGIGPAPRRAPQIAGVTLDGDDARSYQPGGAHRLAATPVRDALDLTCTDDPAPQPVLEDVRAFFYVSAGALSAASAEVRFQPDGSEAVGSVTYTAPTEPVGPVQLWAVMVDGDGGLAWTARTLSAR